MTLAAGPPAASAEPPPAKAPPSPSALDLSPSPSFAALAAYVGLAGLTPASADVGTYWLVSVPSRDIDRHMIVGDAASGLPEPLQGLWWLDGNPLPDEVVSFGGATWDAQQRRLSVPVYGEAIWSWHDSLAGRALYAFVRQIELVYVIQFDDDLGEAQIIPYVRMGDGHVRVPESVVKFTSTRISDGVWLRENYVAGVLVETYVFRRIVRGDGVREPAFADYVRAAPRGSLLAVQID